MGNKRIFGHWENIENYKIWKGLRLKIEERNFEKLEILIWKILNLKSC